MMLPCLQPQLPISPHGLSEILPLLADAAAALQARPVKSTLPGLAQAFDRAGFHDIALALYERGLVLNATCAECYVGARELFERFGLSMSAALLGARHGKSAAPSVERVSIYIPCYNGGHFLRETLAAIKLQSYPIAELILVDDCSTDDTSAIAAEFSLKIIRHEKNRGLAASRNTALAAVAGEYVAGLDADAAPDRFWLERCMLALGDRSLGGTGGRLVERHGITLVDRWRRDVMQQQHGDKIRDGVTLFGCNSVIRTELLRNLGGFNESYRIAYDDVDISERLNASGAPTRYLPNAVCYHCRRDDLSTLTRTIHRWRLPPYELRGAYRDLSVLAARWVQEGLAGLQDIRHQHALGNWWLLFPSYYFAVSSILPDIREFHRRNTLAGENDARLAAYAAIVQMLVRVRSIPSSVREEILRLEEAELLNGADDALRARAGVARDKASRSSVDGAVLLRELELQNVDLAPFLLAAMNQLHPVMDPGPDVFKDIELSLMQLRQDIARRYSLTPPRRLLLAPEAMYQKLDSAHPTMFSYGEEWYRLPLEARPESLFRLLAEVEALKPESIVLLYERSNPNAAATFEVACRVLFPGMRLDSAAL